MAASLRTTQQQFFLEFQHHPTRHAPLNWKGEQIPCAPWLFDNSLDSYEPSSTLSSHIKTRLRVFGLRPASSSGQLDLELMKLKAYLLLNSIMATIVEYPEMVTEVQEEVDGEFPLIELLLLCGVLADPVSMVSTQAFRLLKASLYGIDPPEGEETAQVEGIWTQEKVAQLVDAYAGDFEFGELLTPQMVAAFSIFWNHQYNNPTDQKTLFPSITIPFINQDGQLQDLPVPNRNKLLSPRTRDPSAPRPYQHRRTRCMTPLEKFGSHLLDEPPLCDAFNSQIMNVLKLWSKRADELRHQEPGDWYKCQEAIIKQDLIFFDFLRTPVLHGKEQMSMLRKLEHTLPLDPQDKRCRRKEPPIPRVSLNGFVMELGLFLRDSEAFWFHDYPLGLQEVREEPNDVCLQSALKYNEVISKDFWNLTQTTKQPSEQEKQLISRLRSPPTEAQEKLPPPGLP